MTLLGAPEESGKSQINLDDLVPRKISLREVDGAQCHPVARQPSAGFLNLVEPRMNTS
jgi:hypothetical protein